MKLKTFPTPLIFLIVLLFTFVVYSGVDLWRASQEIKLSEDIIGYWKPHFSNNTGIGVELHSDGTYSYIQNKSKEVLETRRYKVLSSFKDEDRESFYILDYPMDDNDKRYTYIEIQKDYFRSLLRIAWADFSLLSDNTISKLELDIDSYMLTKGFNQSKLFHLNIIEEIINRCNCGYMFDYRSMVVYERE